MGKHGPPRKPTALKRQQGTYRTDRDPLLRRGAAEVPEGAPPCPADLDAEARRVWNEVVPALLKIGTLEQTDGGMLRGYCTLLVRVQKLEALAAAEPILETKAGKKAHPAGVEARKLWPLVEKLASDLGLHYAARARSGVPPTLQDQEAQERRAAAERFIFERAPFTVIEGGKVGT